MRRNDFDVTDSVRTTDPRAVAAEVAVLYAGLYQSPPPPELHRGFADLTGLYAGHHPDYEACDTAYHDLQHVLDVTLAMARLMDGYERGRRDGERLGPQLFLLGTLAGLYHDIGYLRRATDRKHRFGAEYTLVHVSRGAAFFRRYLKDLGLGAWAGCGAALLHYTGYERPVETLRLAGALRRLGQMLGTADVIAQMSDRCYLEKCRDRLYPEFVLGGLASPIAVRGRMVPRFASGRDLVQQTPAFFQSASRRLELQLARAYEHAAHHFGGCNPYVEEMQKNVRYARVLDPAADDDALRRRPPQTLTPGTEPYPHDLLGLEQS